MVQCQNPETKMLIYNCGQYANKPLIMSCQLKRLEDLEGILKTVSILSIFSISFNLFLDTQIYHKYLIRLLGFLEITLIFLLSIFCTINFTPY